MSCSPTASLTSPFLALLRKLRDNVYHNALSDLQYYVHPNSHVFRIEYGYIIPSRLLKSRHWSASGEKQPQAQRGGFSWLSSCSQILAEGLVLFERGSLRTYAETCSKNKPDLEWRPARERTLLPLVREMYVAIAPGVYDEPRGPRMCYNFQPANRIVTDNATKESKYKSLLPHIQRISVEVRTWLMADCDDIGICLPCCEEPSKHSRQSLGSTYEETHFCIELPELQRSSRDRGQERVPNLASLARMLPQLQAYPIELGKSFMVTHVTGIAQRTDRQHWAIRDWIDASTFTWHMTMKPGKSSGTSFAETLKHDGLQDLRTKELKRTPAVVGRYVEEVVFRRDHIL